MARKLTARQKRWLLSAHILLSAVWIGTASCFLVLSTIAGGARDGSLLLGIYASIDILDRILIRPLAIGAAVTGILLSALTQWGLFRFHWIIAKLVLTVMLIASGIIVLGRLPGTVMSIVSSAGSQALQDPSYQSNLSLLLTYAVGMVLSLSTLVVISVFKPGGQRSQKHSVNAQGGQVICGGGTTASDGSSRGYFS